MNPSAPAAPRIRRRWIRILAITAAAVVPLAFAGLTMASLADTDDGIHRIPAAIVNSDEMVTQTAPDGTETPVLAGRLLVTELTGDDSPGMHWRLSNAEEATRALADGEVYAVLTIPSDFSASVVSLSSPDPVQARLGLRTDDAHSYLAGTVAQSLGDGMVRAFGSELTQQYISGIYAQFGTVGEALTQAADGAQQLSDGAATAASGADAYADGVAGYTGGVSSLAGGLGELKRQTAELGKLGTGVTRYTTSVSQLSTGISAATAMLQNADPADDATAIAMLGQLSAGLEQAAAGGSKLATGASGLGALSGGIAKLAGGAAVLDANGSAISSGARDLASGTDQLASGARELAGGLRSGAEQLNGADGAASSDAAEVAAEPIGLEVTTANAVTGVGQVIGTYLVPLALWVGALAIFLVVPPLSRRVLASTAGSGRVLGSAFARAGAVAGVQALLLVLVMHLVAGVSWALLPATLGLALVAAAAFTAFHQLLTIGLGRAGLVISLLLLSVQLASIGGILPSQALAGPFAWLGGIMPLGWATTGLQQLVAGGDPGVALGAALGLAVFGALSALVSRLAIRRTRRAGALGLLLPATGA